MFLHEMGVSGPGIGAAGVAVELAEMHWGTLIQTT